MLKLQIILRRGAGGKRAARAPEARAPRHNLGVLAGG